MEIPARIDKRLNCIIEDYKAIKSEISRRSSLQESALLAYGGIIVFSLKFNNESSFYSNQILLIWLASTTAYLFYISEDDFIRKLNKIAIFNNWLLDYLLKSKNIEELLEAPIEKDFKDYFDTIRKTQNITLGDVVFASESPKVYGIILTKKEIKTGQRLNCIFRFVYFIILPMILTIGYVLHKKDQLPSFSEIFHNFDINALITLINAWHIAVIICLIANIFLHIYLQCKIRDRPISYPEYPKSLQQ